MNKLYSLSSRKGRVAMLAALFGLCAVSASAVDYPDVYLRGSMANNWNPSDSYKFSRTDDKYELKITAANPIPADCEFKIGGSDWTQIDFGGSEKGISIDYTQTLTLSRGGKNLTTGMTITEATISFTFSENAEVLAVTFNIPGTEAPKLYSGTLPVLYINVYKDETKSAFDDEIISKDLDHKNYFSNAEYWLEVNDCEWMKELGAKNVGSADEPLPLEIKARGNWTRIGFSKKPFKLKLGKKQDLLGLTPEKSKHYAILAHADDNKGYLRNFTGFNLGERIGLPWTPGMQPVEVIINGDYRGLYFLTESIRVGDGRIDITELGDNVTDKNLVSGGYVVELDNYDETNQIRMEEKYCTNWWEHHYDPLRITWDTPEVYSELQQRFVTDQFSAINDAIGANSDDTWKYLDLDDAARYYLVNEIVSHVESFHGSTYLYRDHGVGKKWHFSPLWDMGNAFNGYTDSFLYDCDPFGNTWIPSMRMNSKFNDKVEETWAWFMQNEYEGLLDDMEVFTSRIAKAASYDHDRWKYASVPGGGQPVADNSDIKSRLNEVKGHLEAKINWLKEQFGDFASGGYHAEPTRDDTEAAELPEYAMPELTGIGSIEADENAEYYDLQGFRISNPQPGSIYIVKKGTSTFKAILR